MNEITDLLLADHLKKLKLPTARMLVHSVQDTMKRLTDNPLQVVAGYQ